MLNFIGEFKNKVHQNHIDENGNTNIDGGKLRTQ